MIITGIGSRKTPQNICDLFTEIGEEAKRRNWWIRSGGAAGADTAFERGAKDHCIVYLPWPGFNKERGPEGLERPYPKELRQDVLDIVYKHEPYAAELPNSIKTIKSRNVFQVLGENLKTKSNIVICWTPGGEIEGGTGLAIKIAKEYEVPVLNLGKPAMYGFHGTLEKILEILENNEKNTNDKLKFS